MLSCSLACGIFPDQRWKLGFLHWQTNFRALSHPESTSLKLFPQWLSNSCFNPYPHPSLVFYITARVICETENCNHDSSLCSKYSNGCHLNLIKSEVLCYGFWVRRAKHQYSLYFSLRDSRSKPTKFIQNHEDPRGFG